MLYDGETGEHLLGKRRRAGANVANCPWGSAGQTATPPSATQDASHWWKRQFFHHSAGQQALAASGQRPGRGLVFAEKWPEVLFWAVVQAVQGGPDGVASAVGAMCVTSG